MKISLTLPDEIARTMGENPEAVARRILENAAIENYRTGRFSQRQVGEVLGLDYWQTEKFLADNHVALNYTAADLEADRVVLAEITQRP